MSDSRRPKPAPAGDPIPTVDEVFGEVPSFAEPRRPGALAGVAAMSAATLAATGGALLATDAPQCGSTRAEEVSAHGPVAVSSLRRGEVLAAVREVAIASGFWRHRQPGEPQTPTRVTDFEMRTAGVPAPVEPQRPQLLPTSSPEPGLLTDGGVTEVQPTPRPPPPAPRPPPPHAHEEHPRHPRTAGRMMVVDPSRQMPFKP